MNDKEFSMLSQFGVPREFRAGELVFRKGDASGEMYFIVTGSVDLKFEGDREDKTIGGLPPVPPRAKHQASASLGWTLLRDGEAKTSFMERADKYLYRAKESGKNQVVWEGCTT